jgi:hypothetical protein
LLILVAWDEMRYSLVVREGEVGEDTKSTFLLIEALETFPAWAFCLATFDKSMVLSGSSCWPGMRLREEPSRKLQRKKHTYVDAKEHREVH